MVGDEVDTPLKNECQFAQPLGVNCGIETLNMIPLGLPMFLVLWGVFKAHSNCIISGEKFLEDFNYGKL